ncbi:MAG: histidinol-phosphate transaminase [Lachnospiraceae bacterium]|nr:histidinol-phosphate transaminase [Lachnospiraceae bacterium]
MSWEDNVKRVVPYVPGEQPKSKVIKLNTNENPYPPSPKVREVLSNYDIDELRLYPDVNAGELGMALAKYYGLNSNQVFVGVGSDDVLAIAFMTFFNSDKEILFPDITYSFYDVWADLYKIPYRMVELNDEFRINIEDYLVPNGGIVIPNPNAPTGVEKDVRELEKIVAKNPDSVVIIDEAYVDFGATSMLPLINKYDNLLIVQTYSKSRSMAGARIGMAFGNEKLIKYMNDVKFSINSYTMNRLTVAAGTAALEDEVYFKKTCDKVIATRERTKVRLRELGFDMPDSKSNFVFVTHESIPASDIFNAAKSAGIYLRWWNKDRISNRLRISIGTDGEMDALFAFLKEYIEARG